MSAVRTPLRLRGSLRSLLLAGLVAGEFSTTGCTRDASGSDTEAQLRHDGAGTSASAVGSSRQPGSQGSTTVVSPPEPSFSTEASTQPSSAGSTGAPGGAANAGGAGGDNGFGGAGGDSSGIGDGGTGGGGTAGGGTAGGGTAAGGSLSAAGAGVVPTSSAVTSGTGSEPAAPTSHKPRLINTTDLGGDPDDQQSMVRQLVMSNEFELEGLIVSTSCWKKTQDSTVMLDALVDAYGQVLPNLSVHAEGYPSLEYVQSISVLGNTGYAMAEVGAGKESPGSELIINAADKDDPRPLWVTCWGGCNTLAQAIWTVQNTRSASELVAFVSKLRVYDVLGQDDSGAWMVKNFPDLFYIRGTGVYGWAPSDSWIDEHVQSHGALGAVYPDTMYDTEGDSPSFMHLFPNGLHDPERVEQGGWGGRFDSSKQLGVRAMEPVTNEAQFDPYAMYSDTEEGAEAIAHFRPAYDNDFEARMDWSMTNNYADANHAPRAVVMGDDTRNVLYVSAGPGSQLVLDAEGSTDPDGDTLKYAWSFYAQPSSYPGSVTLQGAASASATFTVPSDASAETIHIVLQVYDDGAPNLYAYRRVIVQVP